VTLFETCVDLVHLFVLQKAKGGRL
jgi:hypothetical protein